MSSLAMEISVEKEYMNDIQRVKQIMSYINPEVCIECNKCVGSCTAASVYESFRPSRIIKYVSLGMISHLIAGKDIWLCVQCLKCVDVCKMDVKPAEIIILLRNLAVKYYGFPSHSWKRLIESVQKIGSMSEETEQFAWRRTPVKRKDVGLSTLNLLSREKLKVLLQIGEEI